MGCVSTHNVFEVPDDAPPEGHYDPRWDRYRFAKFDMDVDQTHAHESEPTRGQAQRDLGLRSVKAKLSLSVAGVEYHPSRPRQLPLLPEDNGVPTGLGLRNEDLREKVQSWMKCSYHNCHGCAGISARPVPPPHGGALSHQPGDKSRGSLHTIYTQEDEELVRTKSMTERQMADPSHREMLGKMPKKKITARSKPASDDNIISDFSEDGLESLGQKPSTTSIAVSQASRLMGMDDDADVLGLPPCHKRPSNVIHVGSISRSVLLSPRELAIRSRAAAGVSPRTDATSPSGASSEDSPSVGIRLSAGPGVF
eukprot:gene19244-29637_t